MSTWAERLHAISSGARRRLRKWWLRQRGVQIGSSCWIQDVEIPRNPWDVRLEDGAMLDHGVTLICSGERTSSPRLRIGENVYINRYTVLDASESLQIGAQTMIGPHCYLTDHDHGMELDVAIGQQPLRGTPTRIGENVWIGAGAMILKGVTVGDQAVVGAGAVVTKDVAPATIVGGVPSRVLRSR